MGQAWDYQVPSVDIWQECFRVLKPGGHLLAFAGTRTQHRMCVNIEDAGFEIRDMIAWVYGSGFPKSMDVSKAIDKTAGAEREVIGMRDTAVGNGGTGNNFLVENSRNRFVDITAPATPEAQQWEGWGTALKPALEPITVARKPFKGTVAANVLEHGTGAINIDGCRVGTEVISQHGRSDSENVAMSGRNYAEDAGRSWTGRWPANLIHDGSDEVVNLFPESKGQQGAVTGKEPSSKTENAFGKFADRSAFAARNDSGSAARFFYCSKASKADRNSGLDGIVSVIIEPDPCAGTWESEAPQVRLLVDTAQSPPRVTAAFGAPSKGATEWNTMLSGSWNTDLSRTALTFTTKTATSSTMHLRILSYFQSWLTSESTQAVSLGMESGLSPAVSAENGTLSSTFTSEKMASVLGAEPAACPTQWRISVKDATSTHPTVKPTDLMAYLCRLVTPPGGIVLDPFMGSGTTGKAALSEGFQFVGIERDPDYYAICESRFNGAQIGLALAP